MGKPKNTLVVEAGREAIKLSYLQREYGKYKLQAYHCVPLAGDKKLPWLEDSSYSELISTFLLQNQVDAETVILSIPAQAAVTSYVRFPQVSHEDAEGVLRFEIEKQIPIPLEDVHYGYRTRSVGGAGVMEAAIAAVDNTTLGGYLTLLEESGLKPSLICLDMEGYINYWIERESARDRAFIFVKIQPESVDFCLVERGLLKYYRSIPREGETPLDKLISRELQAAGRLMKDSMAGEGSFIAVAAEEEGRDAAEGLEESLGMKVFFADDAVEARATEGGADDTFSLMMARGLAQAAEDEEKLMNLFPEGLKKEKKRRNPVTPLKVFLIVGFIILGFLIGRAYNERERLKEISREVESLREQVSQVEELKSQVEDYSNKLAVFDELRFKEARKLDLLREMTVLMPPTSWLSVMIYENGKFDISGYAESASGLIPILENSDYLVNAQFIAPIVKRPWGEEFKIRVDVER